MFTVLFEVHPHRSQHEEYLGLAKMLRPELERIAGFVDNVRYASLTRDGWILSLSDWRDEKALVRWRTQARHHDVQAGGRQHVLADYHLRVGQLTDDTRLPEGCELLEQRLDVTETGDGNTAVLITASRSQRLADDASAEQVARFLGLDPEAAGLRFWDVYDAMLTPGELILQSFWEHEPAALAFIAAARPPQDHRLRRVRIVRDYGMYDRHEAPQYYPDVAPAET